jgi:hypothetical protein
MTSIEVSAPANLETAKRITTGLAFIFFPLLFVFAFAVHPGLLNPHLLGPQELILRAHQNGLLQFGHVLVTISTVLLVVMALKFMKMLERTPLGWAGLIGAALAILGAIMLAADKGALDTLPENVDKLFELIAAPFRRPMERLGRFPLIYPLLRLYIRTAVRQYPPEGWQTEWVENSREAIRFNMHTCFYFDNLSRYGAAELTASFCRNDDLVYDKMSPYLEWKRTQTIGRGAAICDF